MMEGKEGTGDENRRRQTGKRKERNKRELLIGRRKGVRMKD